MENVLEYLNVPKEDLVDKITEFNNEEAITEEYSKSLRELNQQRVYVEEMITALEKEVVVLKARGCYYSQIEILYAKISFLKSKLDELSCLTSLVITKSYQFHRVDTQYNLSSQILLTHIVLHRLNMNRVLNTVKVLCKKNKIEFDKEWFIEFGFITEDIKELDEETVINNSESAHILYSEVLESIRQDKLRLNLDQKTLDATVILECIKPHVEESLSTKTTLKRTLK